MNSSRTELTVSLKADQLPELTSSFERVAAEVSRPDTGLAITQGRPCGAPPALSRYLRLDVKGPLTGISGEGSGHSFPFRHSIEAMEMDLKCGAF